MKPRALAVSPSDVLVKIILLSLIRSFFSPSFGFGLGFIHVNLFRYDYNVSFNEVKSSLFATVQSMAWK